MVTTSASYLESRHRTYSGEGYDGVVRVSAGAYYGTGVLLFDGRAVLTAAHLFDDAARGAIVHFETSAGTRRIDTQRIEFHPLHDKDGNYDLALIWLAESAPLAAERYELYRQQDEVGQAFGLVGYGLPGTGSGGVRLDYSGSPMKLKAENRFDVDSAQVSAELGRVMGWRPAADTLLFADFDNGAAAQDAFGRLSQRHDLGLGVAEGLIAPGDSGSPAFLAGKVAGVASYTASLQKGGTKPDIDEMLNSSFGELAAWQRVSHHQQWIDQTLRKHYPSAPTSPDTVKKSVVEGDAGASFAFFLLQFTGVRAAPDAWVSVDYATRDGTALAFEDYLPVAGRLVLYQGETQAVIPVEIVGDRVAEPDEYFYLDVFNPVGGDFAPGVTRLTALRKIVDDDGWLL